MLPDRSSYAVGWRKFLLRFLGNPVPKTLGYRSHIVAPAKSQTFLRLIAQPDTSSKTNSFFGGEKS